MAPARRPSKRHLLRAPRRLLGAPVSRVRDHWRRQRAPLAAREIPGRSFALRLARSVAGGSATTVAEWFAIYRLVVPETSNGRQSPRRLELAWKARREKASGKLQREIARDLGFVTQAQIDAAEAKSHVGGRSAAHEEAVRSAVKRVQRNEALLVQCEQRIRDDGREPPLWLRPQAARRT